MSFIKFLQGIGDRLGILESVSGAGEVPETRIQTRTVSLKDLATEIRSGEIRALADSPAELAVPAEKIYEAAGISLTPVIRTINKVSEIIANDACRQKPREAVQKTVLESLASEGISAETLVKDAIARDQALDSFESRLQEKMQDRNQSCKNRALEIEQQIKNLQEEKERLDANLKAVEDQWREWRKIKRAHERELAFLVSYLVDHPVITTDNEDE
jgi:chromosome segregation ATPase